MSKNVESKKEIIREALRRYKTHQATEEECSAMVEAMQKYHTFADSEEAVRAYNVLLCFYFAEQSPASSKMPAIFQVNRRTIFKDISKGIKDLTAIVYGIDGAGGFLTELLPGEEEIAEKIKHLLQSTLPFDIRKEVKNVVRTMERENF